ncbi:MAG: DUF4255 domain-containing protein [Alphaproteobacteria bacterium]|nr:DUF4255 domain-containing protein [Alphaproteobacteria bacterium]
MLDLTLTFLRDVAKDYLKSHGDPALGQVTVTQLVKSTGQYGMAENSIGLSLLNVVEERIMREQVPQPRLRGGQHLTPPLPLRVNLYVIFAAHYQDYGQALRQLSLVLACFRSTPVFTPANHGALDPRLERLSLDLVSPSFEQLNQIWAFIGGKQLPSAIYRVRSLRIEDPGPRDMRPPVLDLQPVVEPK